MNKERRKELSKAIEILSSFASQLYDVKDIVDSCREEEEEYRDNMPENLQSSEKYSMAEEACDCLDNAGSALDDVSEAVDEAIRSIENAME